MPRPGSGWARRFDDPIPLPDGRELIMLRDAGEYIAGLKPSEQHQPHWRTATETLLMAAERGGIVMLADIAMRQALAHGQARPGAPQEGGEEISHRSMIFV